MRQLKRVLAVATASALAVTALAGCNKQSTDETSTAAESAGTSEAVSEEETTGTDETEAVSALDGVVREDLTATDVAVLMGNGINLGNTMEAYKHSVTGDIPSATSCETAWGQPVTTQEMIDGMKAAGFDTIRIPVAWTNGMHFEEGDYTISEELLDRVEEIVNYALNDDMYVIINDHWDGSWWGMFGNDATEEAAFEMYTSMWTQIGERFGDYGDYVIFESANEELGDRLNDTDIFADVYKGYNDKVSDTIFADAFAEFTEDELEDGSYLNKVTDLDTNEQYEMVNKINQTFVDTIRDLGGNNANRFLLIAGFSTDIAKTCDSRYQMPEDSANEKLLLSVHYYTPSSYCLGGVSHWGTEDEYNEMNSTIAKLAQYTEAGYPVVIGEYAVCMSAHEVVGDTDKFTKNLLDLCDYYGIVPVLWDCNNQLDKSTCEMSDATMAQIYLDYSYDSQKDLTQEELQEQAQADMDAALEAAKENDAANKEAANKFDRDGAIAWIMYDSADYSVVYSVGDEYTPESISDGVVATDCQVTGEGSYSVSLDFTGCSGGYASGMAFGALGIYNGTTLYPDYEITIDSILVNGEEIEIIDTPISTSDDDNTERVNLYNGWTNPAQIIVDTKDLSRMETLTVNFTYGPQ